VSKTEKKSRIQKCSDHVERVKAADLTCNVSISCGAFSLRITGPYGLYDRIT